MRTPRNFGMPLGKVPTLVKTPLVTSLLADTDAVNEFCLAAMSSTSEYSDSSALCFKEYDSESFNINDRMHAQTGPRRKVRYTVGQCVNKWELLWNAGQCCT